VASERQIAANRNNARKSTGPRSSAGQKRTSHNAHSHGLTLSISSAAIAKHLEKRTRKIAGGSKDEIVLEHARAAAQAELDLARVRQVKLALIERVSALGALDAPQLFGSLAEEMRYLKSILSGRAPPALPERVDPSATMPTQEPERTVEAVRTALPELVKLERYESRAVSRRDRAIREIVRRRSIRDGRSGNDEATRRTNVAEASQLAVGRNLSEVE
jgi:hypothetical protein